MSLIWLLAACSSGTPERHAIASFRRGADALNGDPNVALEAFRLAREHQPDAPLLRAWEGMALARGGHVEEAILVMDELIERDPRFAEARYNRAAWLARTGRLEEAGAELARALELGVTRGREAMRDPDFTPHLAHPAFGFLPDEMLMVAVEAPSETAFWGSEVTLRFRVLGTGGEDVMIQPDQAVGPLVLVGVREDEHESSDGLARDLRYLFKVDGAGKVILGPFTIRSGRWSTRVKAIRFAAEAPSGKRSAQQVLSFRTPSEVRGGWGCEDKGCQERPRVPLVRAGERGVEVLMSSSARIRGAGKEVRYHYSSRGVPVWAVSQLTSPVVGRLEVWEGSAPPVVLVTP